MYEPVKELPSAGPKSLGSNGAKPRAGWPVDPLRILRALRNGRWWLLASVLASGVAGVAALQFAVPPEYDATTNVVYEGRPGEEVFAPRELRTLVDSVKLPSNLEIIRDRTDLEDLDLTMIGASIDVTFDPDSDLFTVTTYAPTRDEALRLADTTVQVFLESQQSIEQQRLQEDVDTLQDDLTHGETTLTEARRVYDDFRRENHIADLSAERQRAIESAADMRAEAELARAEATAADARRARLRSEGSSVRSVGASAGADAQLLAQAQNELAQLRSRYTDAHPRVQAAKVRVQSLRERMAAARAGSPSEDGPTPVAVRPHTPEQTFETSQERQDALRALALEAQQRVEQLSSIEGEASALLAAVHVAESHRTELQAALTKARDAARTPATGFRVVAPAVASERPVGSGKRLAIALLASALMLTLGVLGLVARELRGLRLRTAAEIAYWGVGPVIGSTTWPRWPGDLNDLIHELDDFAPDARGRTLVVGARESDSALAAEIATALGEEWRPSTEIDREQLAALEAGAMKMLPRGETTDLATRDPDAPVRVNLETPEVLVTEAWEGPSSGPQLRRAARLADRVLVVVTSGSLSAADVASIRSRLGRDDGVGYVVVGVGPDMTGLPDRAGRVEEFWFARRA